MTSPRQMLPAANPSGAGVPPRVFRLPAAKPAPSGTGAGALDTTGPASAYAWLLAWTLTILILALANRTRLGHALLYYGVLLAILFLVVTQAGWFASALAPLGVPVGSLDSGVSGDGGTAGGGTPPNLPPDVGGPSS